MCISICVHIYIYIQYIYVYICIYIYRETYAYIYIYTYTVYEVWSTYPEIHSPLGKDSGVSRFPIKEEEHALCFEGGSQNMRLSFWHLPKMGPQQTDRPIFLEFVSFFPVVFKKRNPNSKAQRTLQELASQHCRNPEMVVGFLLVSPPKNCPNGAGPSLRNTQMGGTQMAIVDGYTSWCNSGSNTYRKLHSRLSQQSMG